MSEPEVPATLPSIFSGENAIERLEDLVPTTSLPGTVISVGTATALSFIPVAGGALFGLFTGSVGAVTARKIEHFNTETARRLDIVCEGIVDLEFKVAAIDARFSAAVMATYQQMITEHDEAKIHWLANAAVNSGSWSPLSDVMQRYFLSLALTWQPEQMQLLTIMRDDFLVWRESHRDQWNEVPDHQTGNFIARQIYGPGAWQQRRFQEDYTAIVNTDFVENTPALVIPIATGTFLPSRLTPVGEQFMRFVSDPVQPAEA